MSIFRAKLLRKYSYKYDTGDEGRLLRFTGVRDLHVSMPEHYDSEWLSGSVVIVLENGAVIWLDDDYWRDKSKEHLEEIKEYTNWVECERIIWAVTDADGNPVDMPQDRVVQKWVIYGVEETKHFDLKEFDGSWDQILKPNQGR